MDPCLEKAKTGNEAVLFIDAAHFVHALFVGFLWCFNRIKIKSPSGRQRFNVLGAIDAMTHNLITVTNTTYINANCFIELMKKVRKFYGYSIPITLILDNASYQKCIIVADAAEEMDINLLYLPTYSPNLNLIERLWRYVKKEVLYSKYYSCFSDFKKAITVCLHKTQNKDKEKLSSLLKLKFQILKTD